MTRTDCPRLGIQCCRGASCRDRGVLHMGMSQPVLHQGQVCTGIEQMRGNRNASRHETCAFPLGVLPARHTSAEDDAEAAREGKPEKFREKRAEIWQKYEEKRHDIIAKFEEKHDQ